MSYEIYKEIRNKEDYFANWDSLNYNALTDELKTEIYEKYVIKCKVFQRDNFSCQNLECKFPESPLTLHHVRFKKNSGKDSVRNGVTVCQTCHNGYHRGKRPLVFAEVTDLPPHIRGHTFKVDKKNVINWKKVKKEMRAFRKELKHKGIENSISWKIIAILFKWLYNEDDD